MYQRESYREQPLHADPQRFTRSTETSLSEKRYVAAGDRAYVLGTAEGGFPPIGTQIEGEMGGVWVHPIKLLTGYWFTLNNEWLPPAVRFTSGAGFVRFELPSSDGLAITRSEFAPDGISAVLIGLTLHNVTDVPRSFALALQARSQLMAVYPWTNTTPSAEDRNALDHAAYQDDQGRLAFTRPDVAWCALIGTSLQPARGTASNQIWGPVATNARSGYSQQHFGSGGELGWDLELEADETRTIWVAVAGSHVGKDEAISALEQALAQPEELMRAQIAERTELFVRSQLSLPEPQLVAAFEWGKMNMADLRRTVTHVEVRDTKEGKEYPPPLATLPALSGIGDGYPDYPWFFGTSTGYIIFPLIVAGMWDAAAAHLHMLRDISRLVNGRTGKVIHEITTHGEVNFGTNEARGNTNETALFASAVDLLWRWSGDDSFRDEMYDFIVDGMRYITTELDREGDGWPVGTGMAERPGMGSKQLDVTTDTWWALHALVHMAESKGDTATAAWALQRADAIEAAFDATWWLPQQSLYADSICTEPDIISEEEQRKEGWNNVCTVVGQKLQQRIWISVKPIECMLVSEERAHTVLDQLESSVFSDESGLFLVGEGGGPDGEAVRKSWTVVTGAMALAEANYGRLGEHQALRFMRSIAATIDLEMPGSLPELAPSPDYDPFAEMGDRMMVMQAWSSYGIGWTCITKLLGIDPDVPAKKLTVVPQIPPSWPGLSVQHLHMGEEGISVSAEHVGHRYRTKVEAISNWRLRIGHTLPFDSAIQSVTLDGKPVTFTQARTSRGEEVYVQTAADRPHTLDIVVE